MLPLPLGRLLCVSVTRCIILGCTAKPMFRHINPISSNIRSINVLNVGTTGHRYGNGDTFSECARPNIMKILCARALTHGLAGNRLLPFPHPLHARPMFAVLRC